MGLKLYHGTTAHYLDTILENGLLPRSLQKRGSVKGNWSHSVPSNKNAVYLTDAYAPYFALTAAPAERMFKDKMLIVEVDTEKLNPFSFTPDEDAIEQATRSNPSVIPTDWSMEKRTRWFRDHLLEHYAGPEYRDSSLRTIGNCAHFGTIPIEAISKIVEIDPNKAPYLTSASLDPSISIINYSIVGAKYRAILKWIFGYDLGEDQPQEIPMTNGEVYRLWTLPPDEEKSAITTVFKVEATNDLNLSDRQSEGRILPSVPGRIGL